MYVIGGLAWSLSAPEAIGAELARLFPHKLPASLRVAARRVTSEIERAWRSYHAGAVASLFDVVHVLSAAHLPLPDDVRDELLGFARSALEGAAASIPSGQRHRMQQHEAAVRKRLRHAAVAHVLDMAEIYREEDALRDEMVRQGADRAALERMRRSRAPASQKVNQACEEARAILGASDNAGWNAFYVSHRDVQAAIDAGDDWPGIYYVPTRATCERLGWSFILPHFEELVGSDAPRLGVA